MKKKPARNAGASRRFYGALVLIAVAGVALLAWLASRSKRAVTAVDPSLPPAQAEGYLMGSANAPVQIIEFADFECPGCAQFATVTEPDVRKRIVEAGLASYRFYDFPLPQHRNSIPASSAAACANDQGKFWEMHDRIFSGQYDWNTQAVRNPKGVFEQYAKDLGLNMDAWEECYDSGRHLAKIEANRREGERRMISQTPTFIIGKRQIPGNLSYDELKAYVDSAAADGATGGPATSNAPAGAAASPPPR